MPIPSFPRRLTLLAVVALVAASLLAMYAISSAASSRRFTRDLGVQVLTTAGQVLHLSIPSPTLGARAAVVYLPPGYADAGNRGRRYPVLYLLSGAPGSAEDWFRSMHAAAITDQLISEGKIAPLILVSPDANGGAHRDSQFLNSSDGHHPVETFLAHDVVNIIDARFRTLRSATGRGLAGYSAGAYGALNVGLHHPDLFGVLAGFSGYYTADPSEVTHPERNHPMSTDPAFLRFNSPSFTITTLRPGRPTLRTFSCPLHGHPISASYAERSGVSGAGRRLFVGIAAHLEPMRDKDE